jgi:uncharacterized membrane protein YGL010W
MFMKSLEQWLDDYEVSHKNETNRLVHKVCVPAIFFSVFGMLWSVRAIEILPPIINLATVLSIPVLFFYFRLSLRAGSIMVGVLLFCTLTVSFLESLGFNWIGYLLIFVAAWIGQFWGHKIEGKKPSFFQDLQFLLIGPLWTIYR